MTITLFLERVSLLGALSAIVLAVFWPHVKPRVSLLSKSLSSIIYKTLKISKYNQIENTNRKRRFASHAYPELRGKRLNRIVSSKETPLKSVYRSVEGFSQSKLSYKQEPSFARDTSLFSPNPVPEQLEHLARGQQKPGVTTNYHHQQQQSSALLSIYTACIVALIIYTLTKALGARFNDRVGRGTYRPDKFNREERDLESILGKRKLTKMSKEERIRELMKQHGGKNLSSAIRFLATELEKQKQSILENLTQANRSMCLCDCHFTHDITDTNHNVEGNISLVENVNRQTKSNASASHENID